jgi:hypothetical protein
MGRELRDFKEVVTDPDRFATLTVERRGGTVRKRTENDMPCLPTIFML